MKKLVCAIGMVLALCLLVWADGGKPAANPSFAGTWVLDVTKSKLPEPRGRGPQAMKITGQTLTVTQDAKVLVTSAETTVDGGTNPPARTASYNLDGSETSADISMGQRSVPTKFSAKWLDGGKLELDSTSTFEGQQGSMTRSNKETWSLSDGGKTLNIHRTRESMGGTDESDWVYTKK